MNFISAGPTETRNDWKAIDWDMSCDFPGNDLLNVQIPSELCGGKCAETIGCTHFTWTEFNGGTCWMKNSLVSKNDAVNTYDPSMFCGIISDCRPGSTGLTLLWNENNWAMSCDFCGNDLSNVKTSAELCGSKCTETLGCTHFTWTEFNGGTCWMKTGPVSKNEAFPTNDSTAICGVMTDPKPTDKVAGSTTRYWDCCKVSCAWPGKVSESNSYVKSCRRDGNTFWNDANTGNGCENGGEAFVCNNQMPWAINDQLAYGFVAATIPGLTEQQCCCACYQLDFTSGPVVGKTMIVQIVNSGSDIGSNQFNLQIPGGGVGIFNGCSSQWNAPTDGWGQRYGGVSSRQQCYNLSEAIQPGCLFRFDWFKGADNPTMLYSGVKCPAELVARTGCSRND